MDGIVKMAESFRTEESNDEYFEVCWFINRGPAMPNRDDRNIGCFEFERSKSL